MIPKNPFLAALFSLFVVSSIIHIFLLIIYSFFKFSDQNFNFFSIVGFNLFFPKISEGFVSQLISILVILGIYFFSLFIFIKKNKN